MIVYVLLHFKDLTVKFIDTVNQIHVKMEEHVKKII